ncbi:Nitrogen permease regulator 3 [Coniosporium apollinis]|uniref:Nitrogen permease regulator 3 n=1 Tax=Coniosporium apollinis TaxID=61459 RepID=A0ABQ9P249_9PEZI|nr:Nitrogen permease regulator 3 [Coniosporium apollinis]
MPHPPLPPNPSLVAIFLIVKSHTGPRFVFHYPPHPRTSGPKAPSRHGSWSSTADGGASSEWGADALEDGEAGEDADVLSAENGEGVRGRSRGAAKGAAGSARTRGHTSGLRGIDERDEEAVEEGTEGVDQFDNSRTGSMAQKREGQGKSGEAEGVLEWERVLGFNTESLEKLLSPPRGFSKRRFEVGLEGLVFLGAPTFVRADGSWKKKRRKHGERGAAQEADDQDEAGQETNDPPQTDGPSDEDEGVDMRSGEEPFDPTLVQGFEPGYGHDLVSASASEAGSTNGHENDMSMFNVVFVLNPPALEYQLRVKEMYDNVVRKYAKVLREEQARSSYVWKEAREVLAMKQKAKENKTPMATLWHQIISSSALAKSIAIVFDSISSSKIAHVHLDAGLETSFQIPQAISTPYVPTTTEPQIPGLWLTTASVVDDEDPEAGLSPHCALLLLEDAETLLKEIEGDAKERSALLAFYIRNSTPTKSLQKLAAAFSIKIQHIQLLANHLIYWRRARAIPPLNQRDTYIVSPNADMRALSSAIVGYAARFPTLPPLMKMLERLSGAPRPYGSFIPSKDHRSAYMEILAWLMRGGWVTQLRTFAWVRVSAKVKGEVLEIVEREAREEAEENAGRAEAEAAEQAQMTGEEHFEQFAEPKENAASSERKRESAVEGTLSSPSRRLPPTGDDKADEVRTSPATPSTPLLTQPIHTPLQASPLYATSTTTKSPAPMSPTQSRRPSSLTSASVNSHPSTPGQSLSSLSSSLANRTASLVKSPQRANALEARWLEHIGNGFVDEKGDPHEELRELWPVLVKYLDGRHALEEIAGREGMKRKRVLDAVKELRERGLLVIVKHW